MATYYFRNTGDVNWGTASNWSLTDGGGATGAVPTTADDAYFTSNSGNCTLNSSNRVCKTLIFSGVGAGDYAGTFTATFDVTVYGNAVLSATMTISGAGNLNIFANGASLTANGKTWTGSVGLWQNVTVADALTVTNDVTLLPPTNALYTFTFNGNVTCRDLIYGANGIQKLNGSQININRNLTISSNNGSSGNVGTTTLNIQGTGTWSGATSLSQVNNPTVINTTGTLTLGTNAIIVSTTLTYTAGTISAGTGTFVSSGCTYNINSSGFTLYNWSALTSTHTINTGTITVNNNMTFNGNTTFAGTGGWTANDLTDSTAGRILTLKDGSPYTVTGNLSLTGTNASRWTIASSSVTLKTLFTLNQGASQSLVYVNGTRIDSSAGQTVWSLGGTLTDTVNWNNGSRPAAFNSIRMG